MKVKTVHIHTDKKFLNNTQMFEGDFFENTTILISREASTIHQMVKIYKPSRHGFKSVLEICNAADLVVIYDLDLTKWKLILSIDHHIKIAWRFFGHELYGRRSDLFKSELTRINEKNALTFKRIFKEKIILIYLYLKHGKTNEKLFYLAIKRCNAFLGLSEQEYNFLKGFWSYLPPFTKLPHNHTPKTESDLNYTIKMKEERPMVIVGNNRSSFNNHLDVIKIIEKHNAKRNYNFTLLFNYGQVNKYTTNVLKEIKDKAYFSVVDDFMSKDDFLEFYQKPSALVIAGYRQMAGANIRLALENGIKIYLDNKNIHKKFMEEEGFKIFSMEDFDEDLKNNRLYPDEEIARFNFKLYKKFNERYNKYHFQQSLIKNLGII